MSIYEMITLAIIAANEAGDKWIENAKPRYAFSSVDFDGNKIPGQRSDIMLDVCGNAHVKFRDRRSAMYKAFKKAGHIRNTESGVIEILHAYRPRQEYGLRVACATAAKAKLEELGVTGLQVWSYID
jgi:hypothetical protein